MYEFLKKLLTKWLILSKGLCLGFRRAERLSSHIISHFTNCMSET